MSGLGYCPQVSSVSSSLEDYEHFFDAPNSFAVDASRLPTGEDGYAEVPTPYERGNVEMDFTG